MATSHLYWYIEALSLTVAQKTTLVDYLKTIGQRDADGNPVNRNHWRVRPDNNAVIFEAWVNTDTISAVSVRAKLAEIFGVVATNITYATTTNIYGSVVTYTYASVQRLRVGVFGGLSATYAQSQAAAQAFLIAFAAAWEDQTL